MPTVDVRDTTQYYERSGDGPAALFVHGVFGDADSWARQAQRFGDGYTVVRYDRRGYRRGLPGHRPSQLCAAHRRRRALIEELDLGRCLVVGLSSGAAIRSRGRPAPQQSAARDALLSEPPLFSLDPGAGQSLLGRVVPRVEQAMAAGRAKAAVDAFLSVTYESFCSMIDEEAKDGFPANTGPGLADVQAPLLAVTPADVAAVAVSTLVIAGKRKPPGLGSAARILAAALPAWFCRARRQRPRHPSREARRVRRGRRGRRSRIQIDRHAGSTGARRSAIVR
jgi:3-oxoadipate enol-lactonase